MKNKQISRRELMAKYSRQFIIGIVIVIASLCLGQWIMECTSIYMDKRELAQGACRLFACLFAGTTLLNGIRWSNLAHQIKNDPSDEDVVNRPSFLQNEIVGTIAAIVPVGLFLITPIGQKFIKDIKNVSQRMEQYHREATQETHRKIQVVENSLRYYYKEHRRMPDSIQELYNKTDRTGWSVINSCDGWGRKWRIEHDQSKRQVIIRSAGVNGQFGDANDIVEQIKY